MRRLAFSLLMALSAASVLPGKPAEIDQTLSELARIQIDKTQIYSVRDITIRRDVLSISLNRGTIAFTEAVGGRVTGAVFIGSGDILAIPPDRIEKQQLYRYTKSALLNEHFENAVFRFTDGTYEEFLKEYQTHSPETVDPEQINEILRWNAELQRRGRFLNKRILMDLLGSSASPLFLAQLEGAQLGWFDAVYDERRTEEVVIQQNVTGVEAPVLWASFNRRSEAREAAAHAHEDKSLATLLAYNAEGPTASVKLQWKVDGERVLEVPVTSPIRVTSVSSAAGQELPFLEDGVGGITVIVPERGRRGEEIVFRVTYAADAPAESAVRGNRAGTVIAASYRDQWIIEGLSRYASAVSGDSLGLARLQLFQESPEGGSYESLGPVSIGFRMVQSGATDAYLAVLAKKSAWIMHMLRMLMRSGESDTAFANLVADFQQRFEGKAISTSQFQELAEKHAGRELDWFFEQWVLATGVPAYHVDYKIDSLAGSFVVEGRILQSGVPDSFTMPVPLYADNTLLGRVTVSADEGEFRFVTKNLPQQVRIDPEGTILAIIQ